MPNFAQEYPRETETNWIIFPRDTQFRKQLFFPEAVSAHPAKMNLYLQQACIEYVAKPGEIIMDIFGGTGSLMIAALQGIRVILLEIEEGYHQLEQQAKDELERQIPEATNLVTLIHADNRMVMPIPCHHIITSPPYASALRTGTKGTKRMRDNPNSDFAKLDRQQQYYTQSARNIGNMGNFFYNQAMDKLYQLCYQSILPGGTLTIILKDRIENQKRVSLTGWADKVCQKHGFKLELWEKWRPPGIQFTAINRMHGLEVVEDESIMVYRRP